MKQSTTITEKRIDSTDWGYHYSRQDVSHAHDADTLRVVVFGSTRGGIFVLEALRILQQQYGKKLCLVGLATDDARFTSARISVRRRIWRHFDIPQRQRMVHAILDLALEMNMEVFTGNIKSDAFMELFTQWNPDLVIMACFGQIVPARIFTYPRLGMYNFHPSDLAANVGAGPQPFEDTLLQKEPFSRVSLMGVTEEVDHGPLVAQTPLVRICAADGAFFDDPLLVEEKLTTLFPYITTSIVREAIHAMATNQHMPAELELHAFPDTVLQQMDSPLSGVFGTTYPFPHPLQLAQLEKDLQP